MATNDNGIVSLDDKDLKIIAELQRDCKQTTKQIAKKTLIPLTTVHNRIRKLEMHKIVKKYAAIIDRKLIGKPISAYVAITINYSMPGGRKINQEAIAKKLKGIGVEQAHILAGAWDMFVRVDCNSIDDLSNVVVNKIREIEGIDKTQTFIILKEI